MKNILLIVCVIFTFSSVGQTYRVVYNYNSRNSGAAAFTDREHLPAEEKLQYELIYSNKVSTYNLLSDSIIKRKSKTVNKRTEVIFEIYLGNAYKDFKKRIYLRQEDFGGSKYLVKRSTDENKWVDVDSTKTILGYMCKKARLESDSTATVWYATTIPIPDGPYSFFGSPGLVLEASSKRVYFVAESVSQLTSIPNIEKPKAGKVVSEDDLRGLALKFLVSTHKSE